MNRVLALVAVCAACMPVVAAEPTADDYMRFEQHFIGDWNTKQIEGGSLIGTEIKTGDTGTWSCQLSPTKNCVLMYGTASGHPLQQSIGGYDPGLKAWKEQVFMADGGTAILIYQHSPDVFQGDPVGKVLKGRMEEVTASGKKGSCEITVTISERDKAEIVFTNRKLGGVKQPNMRVVFERKK